MPLAESLSTPIETVRRDDIDGLRALAVLSVVAYHVGWPLFQGGYVGVDVFFVISGYLITKYIIKARARPGFSYSQFLVRRARRLFPALFATVALTFAAGVLLLSPAHLELLGKSTIAALSGWSNFLFWREAGYFDAAVNHKPLIHTWSLSAEVQIYAIWPILLTALFAIKHTGFRVAIYLFGIVAGTWTTQWLLTTDPEAAFYLPVFRMVEFALGAAVVWSRLTIRNKTLCDGAYIVGILTIASTVTIFNESTSFPGVAALVPAFGAALMISTGGRSGFRVLTSNRPLVAIGVISYSIYLVHWPLLVYVNYWKVSPLGIGHQFAIVIGSIAIAALMYRFVENPFRYPSASSQGPRLTIAAYVILAVSVSAPAAHAVYTGGWPWRLAAEPTLLASFGQARPQTCTISESPGPGFTCSSPGDGSNGVIALIGDSHAHHFVPAIESILDDNQTPKLWWSYASSCIPVVGAASVLNSAVEKYFSKCISINDQRFDTILNRPDIHTVILAARWAIYTEPDAPGLMARKSWSVIEDRQTPLSSPTSKRILAATLRFTAKLLRDAGKRVVLVGQVPHLGVNPIPCLSRPTYLRFDINSSCRHFTRDQAMRRNAFTDTLLDDVADELGPMVEAVLPSRLLCPKETKHCLMYRDGILLYRDDDHLSVDGSKFLIKNELSALADAAALGQ